MTKRDKEYLIMTSELLGKFSQSESQHNEIKSLLLTPAPNYIEGLFQFRALMKKGIPDSITKIKDFNCVTNKTGENEEELKDDGFLYLETKSGTALIWPDTFTILYDEQSIHNKLDSYNCDISERVLGTLPAKGSYTQLDVPNSLGVHLYSYRYLNQLDHWATNVILRLADSEHPHKPPRNKKLNDFIDKLKKKLEEEIH